MEAANRGAQEAGRDQRRARHRAPARAVAQRVRRHRHQLPLLLHAEGHVRPLRERVRGLPGRVRHARRGCSRPRPCARRRRSATSRSCCSTRGYWGGLTRLAEDTMLRDGQHQRRPTSSALVVTDDFERRARRRSTRSSTGARAAQPPSARLGQRLTQSPSRRPSTTGVGSPPRWTAKTAWSSSVPGLSITSTSVSSSGSAPKRSATIRRAAASRCSTGPSRGHSPRPRRGRCSTCASARSNAGRVRASWRLRAKYAADDQHGRTSEDDDEPEHESSMSGLVQNGARSQVRADLALDALQRVVDGLAVAAEPLADRRCRSSRRGRGAARATRARRAPSSRQATSERSSSEEITWLTGSWTVEPGSISSRLGSESLEPGRRRAEGDVAVQRRVLVAGRGLDRGDDLARDAQLREVAERGLAVRPEIADRLVEADQAFLARDPRCRRRRGSTRTPSGARRTHNAGRAGRRRLAEP